MNRKTPPPGLSGGEENYLLEVRFAEYLMTRFAGWCKDAGLSASPMQFLQFLLQQNLITPKVRRHYAILNYINDQLVTGEEPTKTVAVSAAAEYFNMGESTIWNILRNYQFSFEKEETFSTDFTEFI